MAAKASFNWIDPLLLDQQLTEEEYLDILDTLPKDNQYLPDEDPNKFIAKMGAEAQNPGVQTLLNSLKKPDPI